MGLGLQARVRLALQCQRCMTPVVEDLVAQRDFLFVADEATAEALDETSEADVLVLSRDFDALSLVEDELILALPLVPPRVLQLRRPCQPRVRLPPPLSPWRAPRGRASRPGSSCADR